MASDSDFRQRRRAREDEENAEQGSGKKSEYRDIRTEKDELERLTELMERSEPLIEQLNSQYNQFALGVEFRPPMERRRQLDFMIGQLRNMSKPTPAYQFRFQAIQSRYNSLRDRWDRIVKDVETGKIKRVAKPNAR